MELLVFTLYNPLASWYRLGVRTTTQAANRAAAVKWLEACPAAVANQYSISQNKVPVFTP